MKDKTEEMSELVETLRAAARRAHKGNWKYGGGYVWFEDQRLPTSLTHGHDGLMFDEDGEWVALASPQNILKLLSSLPPSGPDIRLTKLITAVQGLFDDGFIDAGTREHSHWGQELASRLHPLRTALREAKVPPSGAASEATVNAELLKALKNLLLLAKEDIADPEDWSEIQQAEKAVSRAEALHEG